MDSKSLLLPLLFLLSAALLFPAASGGGLCINYGRIANNLPSPEAVARLVGTIHAAKIRIYDTEQRVLRAFAGTNVEITVGLGNEYLASMADYPTALAWVKSNVTCYMPQTKITSIAVGNEVLTADGAVRPDDLLASSSTASPKDLLPAMENIHKALDSLGYASRVSVTTAHNLGILNVSYPPSAGEFHRELNQYLKQILDFHCKTGSPFMINAYPYFAYRDNPKHISLEFVLFEANGTDVVVDPATGLHYDNMFEAQIDAAHAAMEKLGYKNVCLQVSETGWPSDGDEAGATTDNAKTYNTNLLKLINSRKGTPMRPDLDLNVYIFALFNENLKPGPKSERNFGLFKPDMTPVYELFNLNGGSGGTPQTGTPQLGPPAVVMPSPDGYIIDGAGRLRFNRGGAFLSFLCTVVSTILLRYYSGFM
ncbi:glucan endo-1 3-beta-glucosidas [Striga asiatica]|uniref:glucan endo-1,3-beta-D-glucosidase n=1 Tax=Striga asiatica TaxID=4170 RepID=A0A5A7NZ45_STRAF|nr:glucan endo-1 3-beta-glucosidas [Striga asiatica]